MNTCKCDVCGKPVPSDTEQFVVCEDCRKVMHGDVEEVGDNDGNS